MPRHEIMEVSANDMSRNGPMSGRSRGTYSRGGDSFSYTTSSTTTSVSDAFGNTIQYRDEVSHFSGGPAHDSHFPGGLSQGYGGRVIGDEDSDSDTSIPRRRIRDLDYDSDSSNGSVSDSSDEEYSDRLASMSLGDRGSTKENQGSRNHGLLAAESSSGRLQGGARNPRIEALRQGGSRQPSSGHSSSRTPTSRQIEYPQSSSRDSKSHSKTPADHDKHSRSSRHTSTAAPAELVKYEGRSSHAPSHTSSRHDSSRDSKSSRHHSSRDDKGTRDSKSSRDSKSRSGADKELVVYENSSSKAPSHSSSRHHSTRDGKSTRDSKSHKSTHGELVPYAKKHATDDDHESKSSRRHTGSHRSGGHRATEDSKDKKSSGKEVARRR